MGLASSQARMLLLTARKSDLEYRAQMISQRKINIAMQTQELATEYSQATSNRVMDLVYYTDGNSMQQMTQKLSYDAIMSTNGKSIGEYLVRTANGKYVVSDDKNSWANVATKLAVADNRLSEFYEKVPMKDSDGNILKDENGAIKYQVATDSSGNELKNADGTPQYKKTLNYDTLINSYSSQMQVVSAITNADFFQSSLKNGSLYLYQAVQSTASTDSTSASVISGYKSVSWSALDCIYDHTNTEDDAAAEAEYEAKALVLSNQDKMLDLELNQIETQHNAIETEYDSVKKVIENNIKVSYKVFA